MTRVLYTDVDGTLVGPLGNLFWTDEGALTLVAAQALVRAHAEGLEIVALSGRGRVQMFELGRLLGLQTWFCELGAIRVYGRGAEMEFDNGAYPGPGTSVQAALRPAFTGLIEAFPDRLEAHDPWNENREVSLLVRGEMDPAVVRTWLDERGFDWVDLVDNGVIPRRYESIPAADRVHAYHVAPRGVSKREAIAADRRRRGLDASECAMVGDAAADLACHSEVGRCFVVANALVKEPGLADHIRAIDNAEVTGKGHTEGFAEVIAKLLD